MKHFAVEDWVYLASGRTHPELATEMRTHVAGGCGPCNDAMRRWRLPLPETDLTDDTRSSEPDLASLEPPLPARLIRDSAAKEPPTGVRSAKKGHRRLHYEAGSFVVDLHLELDREAMRVSVAGQILHQPDPLDAVADLRVLLVEGNGETVAKTRTNESGEFVLDFDAEKRLRLAIVINEKRAIVIPSTGPRARRND